MKSMVYLLVTSIRYRLVTLQCSTMAVPISSARIIMGWWISRFQRVHLEPAGNLEAVRLALEYG